ncbi:MAG: TonB-dependent receptor [Bacteroidota bacterium]
MKNMFRSLPAGRQVKNFSAITVFIFLFAFSAVPKNAYAQVPDSPPTRVPEGVDTLDFDPGAGNLMEVRTDEVEVKAERVFHIMLRTPGAESYIGKRAVLDAQSPGNMVSAMNTISGVRMEERSPGSYRLSIRGSVLRSPFGVRNIKVYMGDIPLTDASGNTYLNILDAGAMGGIKVLKGPDGSLYGANSGGVALLDMHAGGKPYRGNVEISGGAFGLFRTAIGFDTKDEGRKFNINVFAAQQHQMGYRDNSNMDREYFHINPEYRYGPNNEDKVSVLFIQSTLDYQTPGGLNFLQMTSAPQLSRQPTATLPGAYEQKAGVSDKTWIAAVSNTYQIGEDLTHHVSFFGSGTDFQNPFITNYETRNESNLGLRTWAELRTETSTSPNSTRYNTFTSRFGAEAQSSSSDVRNYDNNRGTKDKLRAADHLLSRSAFAFGTFTADFRSRLRVDGALSVNYFEFNYNPSPESPALPIPKAGNLKLKPQVMPRFGLSYRFNDNLALRGIVSKGYSTPTSAEIRASDNRINTTLNAEKGLNTEAGLRFESPEGQLYADVSVFRYRLSDAIVRQTDSSGTEHFLNAGGTNQKGIETYIAYGAAVPVFGYRRIMLTRISNSLTLYNFKFDNYQTAGNNYSGNNITGVPAFTAVTTAEITFFSNYVLYLQHNYTDKIALNDGNTVYASAYHLLQGRLAWNTYSANQRVCLQSFMGMDNILNKKYSLGNDLNAAGGRYYNPAAPRSFYLGIKFMF